MNKLIKGINKLIKNIEDLWWFKDNKYIVIKNVRHFKSNGYTLEETVIETEYPEFIVKIIWKKI